MSAVYYNLPRRRYARGTCEKCDTAMEYAQDPGEFLESWCPAERECEHAGCGYKGCGDGAPTPCGCCGLDYCSQHLTLWGDQELCGTCLRDVDVLGVAS